MQYFWFIGKNLDWQRTFPRYKSWYSS